MNSFPSSDNFLIVHFHTLERCLEYQIIFILWKFFLSNLSYYGKFLQDIYNGILVLTTKYTGFTFPKKTMHNDENKHYMKNAWQKLFVVALLYSFLNQLFRPVIHIFLEKYLDQILNIKIASVNLLFRNAQLQ